MMYRVYFNRHADAPLVWSVDEGTQETEINVRRVVLRGIYGRTVYGVGDNTDSPSVWLEIQGKLEVIDSIAYITL